MIVHTDRVSLGAVEYELSVRDELIGFYGSCECQRCHRSSVRYDLYPTVEGARAMAEWLAKKHHFENHDESQPKVPAVTFCR